MTEPSSIFQTPAAIATLANEHALHDLTLFFKTLMLWNHSPPSVYLYCTSFVDNWITSIRKTYPAPIYTHVCLDQYANLSRAQMEQMPSRQGLSNLFHDFTEEKCGLMKWVLYCLKPEEQSRGVLFCDADILWLAPLPEIPSTASLALSRHEIRPSDEDKYGIYNAGFLWMSDPNLPDRWKEACKTSKFFEQAALEPLAASVPPDALYTFGAEVNYGWWRMYQGVESFQTLQSQWSIHRNPEHSGLLVKKQPLCCIHTHWKTADFTTNQFNQFVAGKLRLLKSQPKISKLLKFLED